MVDLIIDSSSDIEIDEANKLGITLVPMEITFADSTYLDGVNLSHREFFEKLIESDSLPITSQITEYRYSEAISKLDPNNEKIIITLSSKLSGTYDQSVRASEKYKNVYVVDSLNACLGERILIYYALRLINDGLDAKSITDILNKKKMDIRLMGLLDTLEYLKRGGRISSFVAFTGGLLSIKPVVSVTNGEVTLVGKAIGSKKGNNLLRQLVDKYNIDFSLPYALGYSGLSDELLLKYIDDNKDLWEGNTDNLPTYMIGSTIGTHVGPNCIAVAFFSK